MLWYGLMWCVDVVVACVFEWFVAFWSMSLGCWGLDLMDLVEGGIEI